ncbi:hypothetical protein [Nocardia asiatica]|uniref:hypothetical protein n=1 Tax=Nocardia asiatica TaxID=209252 RepID=UPI002457EC99|nr:hypothetical protein [Nocardia asiatica]
MSGKAWGWVLFILGIVSFAAGVCLFIWLGLSRGDQVASIVSVFVGVAGLGFSIAGVVAARRAGARPAQSIQNSSLGGNAEVVRNVGGKLTSHRPATTAAPTVPPTAPTSPRWRPARGETAEQSILDSQVPGTARYIDNITGDVETDK